MRSLLRSLFRRGPATQNPERRQIAQVRAMTGSMTVMTLYACTMSSPTALGAVPEDAEAKAHHLKDGKGFTNPWESWREFSGPGILGKLIWYFLRFLYHD